MTEREYRNPRKQRQFCLRAAGAQRHAGRLAPGVSAAGVSGGSRMSDGFPPVVPVGTGGRTAATTYDT
jgi:hypothetical protein